MSSQPALPLLLVGPVTVDVIDDRRLPGGAVSYGARVAAAFGIEARILTIAGPDADLRALEGHDLIVVDDEYTVTMEIDDRPEGRVMRVPMQPTRALSADHLPHEWRTARTIVLAPLLQDDLDIPSLSAIAASAERAGVVMQGLHRKLNDERIVQLVETVDNSLVRDCSHSFTFFRSEREAATWTHAQQRQALDQGARLVTTRGPAGALIERQDERTEVRPFPVASVVDATGAGDVFATAFILALDEGEAAAAEIAAAFAAASVEQIGPAPLPSLSEIKRRVLARRSTADEQMRGPSA